MIDLEWLSGTLCDVLRWQLVNPGRDDGPEVPWAGMRVWSLFLDLNRARASGGFGPSPIAYHEIEAWSHIRREPVRAWEIDIIRALDAVFLEAANHRHGEGQDKGPVAQSRPMTPALFDAVFL